MCNERRLSVCNVIFLFRIHLSAAPVTLAYMLNGRHYTFFTSSQSPSIFIFSDIVMVLRLGHVVSQQ